MAGGSGTAAATVGEGYCASDRGAAISAFSATVVIDGRGAECRRVRRGRVAVFRAARRQPRWRRCSR